MTRPTRYHPLPPDPPNGVALALDFQRKLRDAIVAALALGPVQSFGSRRSVDKALRTLKAAGLIRYTPKARGGSGWERA